jgi:hypothetical protein
MDGEQHSTTPHGIDRPARPRYSRTSIDTLLTQSIMHRAATLLTLPAGKVGAGRVRRLPNEDDGVCLGCTGVSARLLAPRGGGGTRAHPSRGQRVPGPAPVHIALMPGSSPRTASPCCAVPP